ncbi:YibE/F family protein [Sporomusa sp. KB1]|uniref:YibE/F family protein n=1 Tax=Sporomusa sp. KB1 TaxID=943346 RepID=UPI0011AD6F71|nr:YibE/F family protein [Sporomusa sp. KB1]TWH46979.1 putative membrane protein [Sporomusa sp. KB1]
MKKLLLLVLITMITMLLLPSILQAAPAVSPVEYEKGVVIFVGPFDQSMQKQYQMGKGELVTIQLTSGPETGKVVDTFNFVSERSPYEIRVKAGDKVIVAVTHDFGKINYHVSDFDRFDYVYLLVGLFVLVLVVFGRFIGAKSVLVIAFSMLVIFKFFIGQVMNNQYSLTLLTLVVAAIIAVATQLVVSGFSKKTLAAVLGTIGGVAVAGLLSMLSIKVMHLTGLDSEEAMLLKAAVLSQIDFQGVLFAGMVFGALGAVMDVTISIASAVYEVKYVQPAISFKELVQAGMNVGRDIMGTMSNTLILAYAGSSLPLMLLIASQQNAPMLKILNLNMIVTEFARALTGSIGLICAIPLTAIITAMLLNRK